MSTSAKAAVRLIQEDQRRFGDLDLLAKLGHGGMADVYLASVRAKPAELVVLKRLKEDLLDAEHRSMFEDEARIMPRLSHPNVVRTIEVGSQEGWPYLSMEFLDGLPLDQCWEAVAALGEASVKHLVCELLEGLHYAHELRSPEGQPLDVVHRDVSPQNVFVTYDGRVTLVDFGIAKSRGRAQHTSTGVVRGKLAYMAPEQALCDAVDRRADIFASGVLLFELATGRRFWEGLSDVQILKRMTFGDLPTFVPEEGAARFAKGDPRGDALASVLARALAPRPEDRFATAREFREALVAIDTGEVRRTALGEAVVGASRGYREALRAVVDEHLVTARGTQGLVGVDPLAQSGERMASRSDGPMVSDEAPSSSDGPSTLAADEPPRSGPQVRARGAEEVPAAEHVAAVDSARAPEPLEATTHHGLSADRPSTRAPSRARSLAVAGVVLAGLAVAAVALRRDSTKEHERSQAPATAPTSTAQPTPAPAQIEVKFGATKEGTKITIDGAPVGELPFTGRFPRDGLAHTVRAEAEGFQPESRIVVFDRDVDIVFALQAPPPAAPTAQASTQAATAPVPVARPTQVAPTSTTPAANATGGFDYRTNPWAKPPKK